jgi:hypothetical protein
MQKFVNQRRGTIVTGLTVYQLLRLAAAGEIRTEALPGRNLRFSLADLERLRNESSRPCPAQ